MSSALIRQLHEFTDCSITLGFTMAGEAIILINCSNEKSAAALNSMLADIVSSGGLTVQTADEPE